MTCKPEGCKAPEPRVVWMDPPPATLKCPNCECTVPSQQPCHCGATFQWRVDPYEGWTWGATLPPTVVIKVRGVGDMDLGSAIHPLDATSGLRKKR